MKYLVIGAGGTGGAIGGYLGHAGKDVALIARGRHHDAIRENGLRILRPRDEFTVKPMPVYTMEEYSGTPDVIFVCVKGYSVSDTVEFIRRVAGKHTVVIPTLNIYGTGGRLQEELPDVLVTDGCIYIAALIEAPGCIRMKGDILRVVFGVRDPSDYVPVLETVRDDLNGAGILGLLSDNIRRDALLKFSYVSAQGAAGLYYGCPAGPIQREGPERACFCALVREIDLLAQAMGISFEEDIVARNLAILNDLAPDMNTSMQRDVDAGRPSEIDGLIYEVIRLADAFQVELPEYRKIAEEMHRRGLS